MEILPLHDAVQFHFLEFLYQHFFADTGNGSLQFTKTPGILEKPPQDKAFPFAADDGEGSLQTTAIRFLFHAEFFLSCLPKGWYLQIP